jgi:hypothetical protein
MVRRDRRPRSFELPVVMRRAAGLCVLLIVSACGEAALPLPPASTSPTAPDPVGPTFTLSGVITDRFSGGPVSGAGVWVWPITFPPLRRWPPDGMVMTRSDGAGRYRISGLPFLGPVWVSTAQTWGDAFHAPYVHQCVTTVTIDGDATLDLAISPTADRVALNAAASPASPGTRTISGTVYEITATGRQPVSNVWVGWEASVMDGTVAETRTDDAGHYSVCGLPLDRITLSAAPAYGTVFYASVEAGSDSIVDIDVSRP